MNPENQNIENYKLQLDFARKFERAAFRVTEFDPPRQKKIVLPNTASDCTRF